MKNYTSKFIQLAVLTLGFLALAPSAHAAGTWTAAPATPPSSNVDAPINVGTASQQKNGVLGTTGFANFGRAELLGYTHVGAYPCGSGCASGAPATDPGTTTTGGSVGGLGYLAHPVKGNMLLGNVFASLGSSFLNLFAPNKAYALCVLCGTGGTVTGGTSDPTGGTPVLGGGATFVVEPSVTFTPTTATIGTGTADSISYTVSNSSGCTVTSSNPSNNWNGTITTTSGSATGTRSLGTFTSQGTYTYSVSCAPSSGVATATATANITVGPTYIFQVDGNTRMNGYLDTTGGITSSGTIKQGGVAVCLQNGTNCTTAAGVVQGTGTVNTIPKYSSTSGDIADSRISDDGNTVSIDKIFFRNDQGGSIELGGSDSVANTTGAIPYIDFHYGTGSAQDYNARIINSGNGKLDFQTAGGDTKFAILNTSQNVYVKGAVPVYADRCSSSGGLTQNAGTCGGSGTLMGYLLPPAPTVYSVPTVTTGSISLVAQAINDRYQNFYMYGSVNSATGLTDYGFQYRNESTGENGTSGATISGTSLSSGNSSVGCRTTGSSSGSYRAYASTNGGTGYGAWVSFTIPICRT